MGLSHSHRTLFAVVALFVSLAAPSAPEAQEKILFSYGGFNETVGPMWVAVDKGLFKKQEIGRAHV